MKSQGWPIIEANPATRSFSLSHVNITLHMLLSAFLGVMHRGSLAAHWLGIPENTAESFLVSISWPGTYTQLLKER